MENIKTQSTVYPDKQLSFNEWAKELRVGIAYNASKLTDKAHEMMSMYNDNNMSKYIKNIKQI